MANKLIDLTLDSDEEEGEIVSQSKKEQDLVTDLKMELFRRQELIVQFRSENFDFKCQTHQLELQLKLAMAENDNLKKKLDETEAEASTTQNYLTIEERQVTSSTFNSEHHQTQEIPSNQASVQRQLSESEDWDMANYKSKKTQKRPIASKLKPPFKFVVEKIFKYVEENEVEKYFKGFGTLKSVTMREKGIDKYKSVDCSAIIEFESLECKDFLTRCHLIRERKVELRRFERSDDQVTDDWNDEEVNSSRQFKPLRRASRSCPPPKRFRPCNPSQEGTRTIMIRQYVFSAVEQKDIEKYFSSKFGSVNRVTKVPSTFTTYLFIKFDDYKSAENALESTHQIGTKLYDCRPAKDL